MRDELILQPRYYLSFNCPHCDKRIKVTFKPEIDVKKIEKVEVV